MANVVRDQDTIIVQMHDGVRHMLKVTSNQEQKLARTRMSVKPLIGAHYGDIFEVANKRKLQKLDGVALTESLDMVPSDIISSSSDAGNNSVYVDTNTAQRLTMNEVENLKETGVTGVEILKSLIANSDTWSSKTEFAQAKWLKRKQKKYITRLLIEECTPSSLCDVYSKKSREKILGMRPDTLAMILSQASISAGKRVLIFDSALGMVVGSAAYRMRGYGRIMAMYGGQQPHYELVECLNLDDVSTNIIQSVASVELGPAASYVRKYGFQELNAEEDERLEALSNAALIRASTLKTSLSSSVQVVEESPEQAEEDEMMIDDTEASDNDNEAPAPVTVITKKHAKKLVQLSRPKRKFQASNRHPANVDLMQRYLRQGVESVIIATKFDPLPILQQALVLLSPGCPFVVYHEFIEPLVECYNYLFNYELGIRLVLSDTWMREFQVLPGRTHPNMYMSATGGFLLYGTYIGMMGIKSTEGDACS